MKNPSYFTATPLKPFLLCLYAGGFLFSALFSMLLTYKRSPYGEILSIYRGDRRKTGFLL